MKNITWRHYTMMIIGNLFIGIAVALLRISELGTDPFSTINLGLSGFLEIPFGVYQLLFNVLLLIVIFILYRSSIGIGTLVNMVGIGFISDFLVYSYYQFFGDLTLILVQVLMMIAAVIFASMGVALYITPNLGMAPYDALAFAIEKVSGNRIRFPVARIATDIACVVIGFSFGAIVGIATVIFAFFTGPFVQFFRKNIAEPILAKETNKKVIPAIEME
ncbi:membrane protein [Gracilibacillus oryzae]|uniref:Membrane protein n=1 Tax=Gracilibacillus oryzae TaxID=1672701 RepID=A0A7C8KM71_9BACI|nr:membrane protein [Gracilibacillus oryzae]KAB8125764.1 membrane protein [Gracilibacillus oryzae]